MALRGRLDPSARQLLREMRRRPPPPERILRAVAVCVSILLHFVVLLAVLLRPLPGAISLPSPAPDNAIEVRLVRRAPPPPPLHMPRRALQHGRRQQAQAPQAGRAALPPLPRVAVISPGRAVASVLRAPPPAPRSVTVHPQAPSTRVTAVAAATPPAVTERPAPPRVVLERTPLAVAPPTLALQQPAQTVSPVTDAAGRASAAGGASAAQLDRTATRARAQVQVPPAAPVSGDTQVALPSPPHVHLDRSAIPMALPRAEAARPQLALPRAVAAAGVPAVDVAVAVPQVPVPSRGAPALPDALPGRFRLPVAAVAPVSAPAPRSGTIPAASVPASPSAAPTDWARSSAQDRFVLHAPGHGLKGLPGQGGRTGAASPGAGGTPDYVQLQPHGNSDVMQRRSHGVSYTPTRFEQYWVPYGQSTLDTALQRLLDKLMVVKEIRLPRGYRVRCAFGVSIVMFMSCGGEPPAAAPAESDDRRLNMAPATLVEPQSTATPDAAPAPPLPAVNTVPCEVARVAGGPPPPGCPTVHSVAPDASDRWSPAASGGH